MQLVQAQKPAEQAVPAAAQFQDEAAHPADGDTSAEQSSRAVDAAALLRCWQVPEPARL